MNKKTTLYKYRSLQDLRRFLDILINERLYMAHYNEMNDPMEGVFLYDANNKDYARQIWSGKRSMLICCFSTVNNNTLLWSHYADSHKGCCLEVEVKSPLDGYEVCYGCSIPRTNGYEDDLVNILSHKSEYWKYEKEFRFFKEVSASYPKRQVSPYLKIKIKKVYLGYRMDPKDVTFYSHLIKSILGDNILVVQMKREDLDCGFDKS